MNSRSDMLAFLAGLAALIALPHLPAAAAPANGRPAKLPLQQAELARKLGNRYSLHASRRFFLFHASDPNWANKAGQALDALHDHFYDGFRQAGYSLRPIDERLLWICFNTRQEFINYGRWADRVDISRMDGYYSAHTNRVALIRNHADQPDDGIQTASSTHMDDFGLFALHAPTDVQALFHEAAHQLAFNSGLQKRGVLYPVWVSEGLATQFETVTSLGFGPDSDNPIRRRHLREAAVRGNLLPLEQFILASRITTPPGQATDAMYAQCWGLFQFLFQQHGHSLQKYLNHLAALPPGPRSEQAIRQEFIRAFGPIDNLEPQWNRFLLSLDGTAVASESR